MKVPNNNLVAISYKTGYCGSLVYTIASLSPEVQAYKELTDITFRDSTSHENGEGWFNNLHKYEDSLSLDESTWADCYTPKSIEALDKKELVLFRCHPNVAYKLQFIENLRIIHLTHSNMYIPERWSYEKTIKTRNFYEDEAQRLFKTTAPASSNCVKRELLIRHVFHDIKSTVDLKTTFGSRMHEVKLEKLLAVDTSEYQRLCDFLKLTPIPTKLFGEIINLYNKKQWKRF